jgi:type II secretory pathway pseudopilin PulG
MRIKDMLRSERGDTIIEVLLAMSIIGLVLGSSYAIANRSLQIGREAQERTEALKQVETQFERLRTVSATVDDAGTNPLVDFPATRAFCIDESIEVVEFDRPNFDSFTSTTTDEVVYPDGDDNSRPCNTGTDGRYGITITKSDDDDTYLFTIRARWESIGGGPLQELTTQYRIYPAGNTAFEAIAPPPQPDPVPDPDPPVPDPVLPPPTVAIAGEDYTGCPVPTPSYPCIVSPGGGVYSRANFTVEYDGLDIAADSGYNAVVISYDDFSSGDQDPPTNWYNYSINLFVNGTETLSNFLIDASSGVVTLPVDNTSAIDSIAIQWTNNYWVSTNTNPNAYDPDLLIESVNIEAIEDVAYTPRKSTVSTGSSSNITRTAARVSGTVVSAGDSVVTERGIVYGPYTNPSIGNSTQTSTQNSGNFSANLTGLKPNTTYYARAYVRSSNGYSYAQNSVSFTTNSLSSEFEFKGSFQGSDYYLSSTSVLWATAKTRSENIGGHLVTITSEAENAFVASIAESPINGGNWIGLEDLDDNNEWRWVTGEALSGYINWANGGVCGVQPEKSPYNTGGAKQLVAEISMGWAPTYNPCIGFWNDEDTTFRNRFIVEFD